MGEERSSSEEEHSPFIRQCLVTAAVATNMIGYGCMFGFPGIMLPQLQAPGSSISITKEQASWLASVGSIPMIIGNFLVPAVMARLGRKVALYSITLVLMLGWFATILAINYEVLLLGRILHGLSFGMFMPLRSIYIGECTSPRYRGGFLTTSSLAQTSGLLFVHLTGSLISYQLTALSSLSFAFISLLLTIYSPESPSWLATRERFEKSRENFLWLRGEQELPELEKMIEAVRHRKAQEQHQSKFREMSAAILKKEFYKPVLLMFALEILMTLAGGPVMGSYAVTVLTLLTGPEANAHFWMVALDLQRLVFSGVAIYVINKFKRRTMLFSIGALCAGSQLCMSAYLFAKKEGLLPFDSVLIPLILINLQMISVAVGMQPLPAVIAGEVFPLEYRGFAGSMGLVAQCGSIFGVLKSFTSLITLIGLHGAYVVYSVVIAACLMVAWFLMPETSGRTLQQIEEYFKGTPLPDPEYPEVELKEIHLLKGEKK